MISLYHEANLTQPGYPVMKKIVPALLAALLCLTLGSARAGELFPHVRIVTTEGTITLELDAMRAPLTVKNFLRYVKEGHYDGTILHRVVKGFVIQGGGYTPDYKERKTHEPIPNESGNGLTNDRGTIAMARNKDPHSARAQFYINVGDNKGLDPSPRHWGYAVFGQVIKGMDVVDKIAALPTGPGGPFDQEVPAAPVVINKVEIVNK